LLTKSVCLVLGAGASSPYGFPTGAGLVEFAKSPNEDWWSVAEQYFPNARALHEKFMTAYVDCGADSLDEFAGRRTEFKGYCKLLMAYRIGECEQLIRIRSETGSDRDWMSLFIRRMIEGLKFEDIKKARLAVVTFNFDRCFEETLLLRLSALLRQREESESAARERIGHAMTEWEWPFVHVHGSLGPHPRRSSNGRPYERTTDALAVKSAADRIILLDDAQNDSQEFRTARQLIGEAQVVLFLGFGFHRLNCERVLPQSWGVRHPAIFCTTKGLSNGRIEKASGYFHPGGVGPAAHLVDADCRSLLTQIEHVFSD
jgi:hypothetical protein